jgi:hypothetical protein
MELQSAKDKAQRRELESPAHPQRHFGGNPAFEIHRTVGQGSKASRVAIIFPEFPFLSPARSNLSVAFILVQSSPE